MRVQYQILELDTEHLKKKDENRSRVCYIEPRFDTYVYTLRDSFEEAVETIKKYGNDYTEYTIIPRIYMTDY